MFLLSALAVLLVSVDAAFSTLERQPLFYLEQCQFSYK
jgi:hypothetical protein